MPAKKTASKARKKASTKRKKATVKKSTSRKKVAKKKAVSRRKAPARKKVARKKTAKKKPSKKKAAKKKVAKKSGKKKVTKKSAAKKKPARKKAASKKKPASRKKTAGKKKPVSRKKTAGKKKAVSRKETTGKKKAPSRKKKTVSRKKRPVVKKKVPPQRAARRNIPTRKTKRRRDVLTGPIHGIAPYKPKRGEEYMSDDQLEHFRNILNAWKRELMFEVDRTVNHMQDEAANFPDPNDRATQESEFGLELRTRDRERKLLRKIDSALARIDDGSYGYCDETGEEIGLKRLEARPVATLCLEAQERREMAERQFRDRDDRYR
ncbi:MAG: RNA polymerase-binding protein DksA [Gammaproteobacteria bacterium]|nr:RNA polymerase-binding protein DksA [Gammaproteobacteria bacterium]